MRDRAAARRGRRQHFGEQRVDEGQQNIKRADQTERGQKAAGEKGRKPDEAGHQRGNDADREQPAGAAKPAGAGDIVFQRFAAAHQEQEAAQQSRNHARENRVGRDRQR